jgi:ribosomal protein L37E
VLGCKGGDSTPQIFIRLCVFENLMLTLHRVTESDQQRLTMNCNLTRIKTTNINGVQKPFQKWGKTYKATRVGKICLLKDGRKKIMETVKITCNQCGATNFSTSKYCCECGYELPKDKLDNANQETIAKGKSIEKKKKLSTASIFGLIFGVVVCFAIQHFFFKAPSLDKEMMKYASEFNKSCPIMIDAETRLDNIVSISSNTVLYNYSLINMDKTDIDTVMMKSMLEPNMINLVKTNPDMKFFRDHKTTMKYSYKDKNGIYICAIAITPDKYE